MRVVPRLAATSLGKGPRVVSTKFIECMPQAAMDYHQGLSLGFVAVKRHTAMATPMSGMEKYAVHMVTHVHCHTC